MRIAIPTVMIGAILLALAGCDQPLLDQGQTLPPGYVKYTVKEGETPAILAKRFYGKYSRVFLIIDANQKALTANNQMLKPGQVILLPPDLNGKAVDPKKAPYSR